MSLPSSKDSSPSTSRRASPRLERDDAELKELSDDLKTLDEQTERAARMIVFKRNKYIFLLQSMLLGMSYSMVWPTLLKYMLDDATPLVGNNPRFNKAMYGITYVAYPLGSMVSAKLVEKTNFASTKKMILFLNTLEIVGNLMYTVSLVPFLPAVGRLVAGLGDAFYVVLMREMHKYAELSNERLTIECLASFVLGVILSPGINILTTFLHFRLGRLSFNENNFPGLTIAVLFLVMQVVVAVFVRDSSSSDGEKGQNANKAQQKAEEDSSSNRFLEAAEYIKDLEYTAWFVNGFSFVYTYIVGLFELVIPFLMYERLKASPVGVMLLYAIIGTMYAMFLLMTMTVSFDYQPEVFVCLSVVVEIAGLMSVLYFSWFTEYTIAADIVGMTVIVLAVCAMWSVDDVLFINFVQMFVPHHQKEKSHKVRKLISKVAFVVAGLTVPVFYSDLLFYFLPVLIVVVCVLFVNFVVVKYLLTAKK